ncbi:MAG: hypothetical protein AAGI30_02500 [Planctomycetota bacterium]
MIATFDEVIGHERATRVLSASIASGRVHHAWVFAGPSGVGKHGAAVAFAGALLDPTTTVGTDGIARPEAGSAVQDMIRRDAHPDLHLISKELAEFSSDAGVRSRKRLTIAKAVIEERLLGPIARAATLDEGGLASKVFIVDEAELLDRSLGNAPTQASMLKTLEEPPVGSVLILVTSNEHRLLATIRSRCQRVAFGPLGDSEMTQWCDASGLGLDGPAREWVLWFAQGAPGRVATAAESGLFEAFGELEPFIRDVEAGRASVELAPRLAGLVDEWAKERVKRDPKHSKESANREAAELVFAVLAERGRGRLRTGDADGALRMIDAVREAESHAARNVNTKFVFEQLVSAMG